MTAEWLNFGTGITPINNNLTVLSNHNFDDVVYLTFSNLKTLYNDLQIYTLSSSFFDPILSSGDYIAGLLKENTKFIDKKACFIIQKNAIIVGIYDYENKLLSKWNS